MTHGTPDPTPDPLASDTTADDETPPHFERLLGDTVADPRLTAAARELRRDLIEQYAVDSAVDRAFVEGVVASYHLQQVLASWTAALAETLERQMFREIDGTPSSLSMQLLINRPYVDGGLRRVADQVALQERATRLLARNLAALRARARHPRASPDE